MSALNVCVIQSELFWQDKSANLKMFSEKIDRIDGNPHIIVIPEMFTTGFTMQPQDFAETMDGPGLEWMRETASKKRCVVTGSMIVEEAGSYYNRLIWMLPSGEFGVYDKRHLFSYAGEHEAYSAGNKKLVASVNGWKINLQICYDLRFPVWTRQPVEPEKQYDLLINVANWPEKRRDAWSTLLKARAIENQCFVVGVNRVGTDGNGHAYSGDSMVLDPTGKILYHQEFKEDIHICTLEKEVVTEVRNHFPFLKDADPYFLA